jgi:hypothetical protein
MLQQQFAVQVTTLPDCDDITRFDGTGSVVIRKYKQKWAFHHTCPFKSLTLIQCFGSAPSLEPVRLSFIDPDSK